MRVLNSVYEEFHAETTHMFRELALRTCRLLRGDDRTVVVQLLFLVVFYQGLLSTFANRLLTRLPINVLKAGSFDFVSLNLLSGVPQHLRVPGPTITDELNSRSTMTRSWGLGGRVKNPFPKFDGKTRYNRLGRAFFES